MPIMLARTDDHTPKAIVTSLKKTTSGSMAELSASQQRSDNGGRGPKQAACLSCRSSKMKCERRVQPGPCVRCERNGTRCVAPDYHVGRHKGVKKFVRSCFSMEHR